MTDIHTELENVIHAEIDPNAKLLWLWLKYVQGGQASMSKVYDAFPVWGVQSVKFLAAENLIGFDATSCKCESFPPHKKQERLHRPIRKKNLGFSPSEQTGITEKGRGYQKAGTHLTCDPAQDDKAPCSSQIQTDKAHREAHMSKATPSKKKTKREPIEKGSPREMAKAAFEDPKRLNASGLIEDSIQWVMNRYVEARRRQRVHVMSTSALQRNRKHFRIIAKWVCTEDVDIDAYFDFVYQETLWQRVKYPLPSTLSGTWAMTLWEERAPTRRSGKAHAGAHYVPAEQFSVDVARKIAEAHGVTGLADDVLDYLIEQAENLLRRPHHYTPDPEHAALERLIAEALDTRS